MYCSIQDAWNNQNSMESLNKRYAENINTLSEKQFKIDSSVNKINEKGKNPLPQTTVYNQEIYEGMSDINTEDFLLNTEDIETNSTKKKKNNIKNCNELVQKVLECPICKKMLMEKLNLKNESNLNFNLFENNDLKEITILILIGLIIIILLDLFIKLAK